VGRDHQLSILLLWSEVISVALERVCSPESVRADRLSTATSPRWPVCNTRHQDPDQPLGRREEAFLGAALPHGHWRV